MNFYLSTMAWPKWQKEYDFCIVFLPEDLSWINFIFFEDFKSHCGADVMHFLFGRELPFIITTAEDLGMQIF